MDVIKAITGIDTSGVDFNTFEFKNHSEVTSYFASLHSGVNSSKNLYQNIRMHYKIFSNWLYSNGFIIPSLYISSYRTGERDNLPSSPSHSRGYAIDISGAKLHQIYLFYLYLIHVSGTKHHYAISDHNYHIHIDILPERASKKSVEFLKGSYGFRPWTEKEHAALSKYYSFGIESDRLYKYMYKSTSASDLGKEALSVLPDVPKWLILIPLGLIALMFFKK